MYSEFSNLMQCDQEVNYKIHICKCMYIYVYVRIKFTYPSIIYESDFTKK